jgi:hypothetical protein
MPRKKKTTSSRPKGEIAEPKLVVKKTVQNAEVDDMARKIGTLTYGQCSVLKIALDRRLAATRQRQEEDFQYYRR